MLEHLIPTATPLHKLTYLSDTVSDPKVRCLVYSPGSPSVAFMLALADHIGNFSNIPFIETDLQIKQCLIWRCEGHTFALMSVNHLLHRTTTTIAVFSVAAD